MPSYSDWAKLFKMAKESDPEEVCKEVYGMLEKYRAHGSRRNARASEINLRKAIRHINRMENHEFTEKEGLLLSFVEVAYGNDEGKKAEKVEYIVESGDSIEKKADRLCHSMKISLGQRGSYGTVDLSKVKESMKELGMDDELEKLLDREAEGAAEELGSSEEN